MPSKDKLYKENSAELELYYKTDHHRNARGTPTQWNAISKGYDWNNNTGNYTISYNYAGE